MELNDLPEDCLLHIFDYFPDLKQLLSLSTVCSLWNNLVKSQLKKVQYLHLIQCDGEYSWYFDALECSSYNHIYTNDLKFFEKVNVSKLLPNLKYFETSYYLDGQHCMCKATINVLSTSNTLIGLKGESSCYKSNFSFIPHAHIDEVVRHCGNLEYLSSGFKHFIRSFFSRFGDNLKHFEALEDFSGFYFHPGASDSFERIMAKMPNLETLSLFEEPEIEPLKGPAPKMNLKQLSIESIDIESSTLQVLSLFPELPSLYLSFAYQGKAKAFSTSRIHPNVQDLVLEVPIEAAEVVHCGKLINSVLANFPNCKNLMIWIRFGFTDKEMVFKIIEMLPNLNLFVLHIDDINGTWKDLDYFDTVDKHCKSIGRRVAFYIVIDVDFHKKIRYSVNEDIASPFKTDNPFVHKYFRCIKIHIHQFSNLKQR
ncbi:uncharacterized protein LOC128387111 [Panonychus citri]|uniref:uncharacterized protein LOC128387111 n=1 Tax=Panonychus citri TaxID=50023 RepID=UPI00230705B4|nr:uncharacterized protein LOC128387111 [Panonychus citri]